MLRVRLSQMEILKKILTMSPKTDWYSVGVRMISCILLNSLRLVCIFLKLGKVLSGEATYLDYVQTVRNNSSKEQRRQAIEKGREE